MLGKVLLPVTRELRDAAKPPDGYTYRRWGAKVGVHYSTLSAIVRGRQKTVSPGIYRALGCEMPLIRITLEMLESLEMDAVAFVQFMHQATPSCCQVCGRVFYRMSPRQKYCAEHSWATAEGRKYHRGKSG